MSDDKKIKLPGDPVAAYRAGIAARAAALRKERRNEHGGMPNLVDAEAQYDPRKHPPTNLSQIAKAQKAMTPPEDAPKAGLSPETIAGLAALKKKLEETAKTQNPPPQATPPTPAPEPEVREAQDNPPPKPSPKDEEAVKQALRDMDALEMERRLEAIQYDVINNKAEKAAVEKRLKDEGSEISLEEMIVSGVATQMVPITKDFRVKFRTVSPAENRALRKLLWRLIDEDPRLEGMAADLFGMMMIVAAVVQIRDNQLPDHLKGGLHNREFDEDTFMQKFNWLSNYPAPLIHAIGVHANWFDERVRRLFTTQAVKDF